jgi:hypothetical protein
MQVDKFTLDIKGIYKASANCQIIGTPNFNLPPTNNYSFIFFLIYPKRPTVI